MQITSLYSKFYYVISIRLLTFQNSTPTTGRAEELMALFFLLGFIIYAAAVTRDGKFMGWFYLPSLTVLVSMVLMMACACCAMLSKEVWRLAAVAD